MKVRVNRLGERFDNITEVVNGVVVANSVNNLATAVDSDKYIETDPVRLAAAEEGRAADAHAAEVMKDLLDKAEVAKVDDDPLATQEYRDRANAGIQNMYTMPVELEEGLNSAHGLILDEKWDTPEEVAAWIAQEEERRKKATRPERKPVVWNGIEFKGTDLVDDDPMGVNTVERVLDNGIFDTIQLRLINEYSIAKTFNRTFASKIFYRSTDDCLKAAEGEFVGDLYEEKDGEYVLKKTAAKKITMTDINLRKKWNSLYEDYLTHPDSDIEVFETVVDSRTGKEKVVKFLYHFIEKETPFYNENFVSYLNGIKICLVTDDATLAVKVAELFKFEYVIKDVTSNTFGYKKEIQIKIPEELKLVKAEAYLKAIGRKPADWQTW